MFSPPSIKNCSQQFSPSPHFSQIQAFVLPFSFSLSGLLNQRGRGGMSSVIPAWIWPHPMSRQCFSTLRLRAIFSPLLVHTGEVSCSLAKSFFTATTLAPVDIEPMFNMRISPFVSFVTLPCFSVPFVLTPSNRRSKKKFTCRLFRDQNASMYLFFEYKKCVVD